MRRGDGGSIRPVRVETSVTLLLEADETRTYVAIYPGATGNLVVNTSREDVILFSGVWLNVNRPPLILREKEVGSLVKKQLWGIQQLAATDIGIVTGHCSCHDDPRLREEADDGY